MRQKPVQASPEFLEAEALFLGKAMNPPVGPKAVHILFHEGHDLEKFGMAQLAVIAQTAIALSHHDVLLLGRVSGRP